MVSDSFFWIPGFQTFPGEDSWIPLQEEMDRENLHIHQLNQQLPHTPRWEKE